MDDRLLTAAPDDLADDALEAAITTLAANIAAATYRLLTLVAELDRREAWGSWGVASCAHWLNWKCGIALGAAREKVRVARALESLPLISAAFARGELSYSKVRAMTRVATPENEDYLLMIATHGTASHVERLVRAYRAVDREAAAARAKAAHVARYCRWRYDDDGMLVLQARLPAEVGAAVLEALAAAGEDLAADGDAGDGPAAMAGDVPAETPAELDAPNDPPAARRADALVHLAGQFLARGPAAEKGADRHQIVVHVDRGALAQSGQYARSELEQGPSLAPETARRLACDASVVEVEEDARGEALNVGRRRRSVPAPMRRVLRSRDRGCRFPGCTAQRYVDAHHIQHWADGGETRTDNLVLLCRRHHRLVHEGGFDLDRHDDGRLLFRTPAGRPVPQAPPPVRATASLPALMAAGGIDVSAETLVPRWAGERMDLALAVDGLVQCEQESGAL